MPLGEIFSPLYGTNPGLSPPLSSGDPWAEEVLAGTGVPASCCSGLAEVVVSGKGKDTFDLPSFSPHCLYDLALKGAGRKKHNVPAGTLSKGDSSARWLGKQFGAHGKDLRGKILEAAASPLLYPRAGGYGSSTHRGKFGWKA